MSPTGQRTRIVADCHLHFYPCFSLAGALAGLVRRLDILAGGKPALRLGFVVERQGESFFTDATRHDASPYKVEPAPEKGALILRLPDQAEGLTLVAGRQINAIERIEVLSLAAAPAIPDGLPARDVIRAVADAGGIPVLPWAPGKWTGRRGKLIAELVDESQPGRILLGDSAIRPRCFRRPAAMRQGLARGLGMIAGSDPLPFPGDERWMGRYGIALDAAYDPARPVTSVRSMLANLRGADHIVGRRGLLTDTLFRLFAYGRSAP